MNDTDREKIEELLLGIENTATIRGFKMIEKTHDRIIIRDSGTDINFEICIRPLAG